MTELTSDEKETIKTALTHYLKNEYRILADFEKVIENREEVENNIWMYPCPIQTIYLDETFYAVTYGKQRVTDDKYEYNFTDIDVDPSEDNGDIYDYTTSLEWKRDTIFD